MRQSIKLTSIVLLLVCSFVSCDLLTELQSSSSKLTFKSIINQKDTVLFTGNAIKSYNDSTGEIIFVDSMTIPNAFRFHKLTCYLGTDSLFTATMTSDIMSSIVNDLVLNHNLYNGKYYFEDGYPAWIDNLGATSLRASKQTETRRCVG